MSANGRLCCKSLKTSGDKFPARSRNKPRSLIDVASGSLPKSPVSLSPGDEVPHMFTRKPRLQLEKFAINGAKRLLQHNLPIAVFATVRRTAVTEHWTGSLGLDVRRPNYLHPLFGILGDQLAKLGGRAGKHGSSKFDESCLDFGIGEPGVDFLIELV